MMLDGVEDTTDSEAKLKLCNIEHTNRTPIIVWIIESVCTREGENRNYTSFGLHAPEITVGEAKDMIDFLIGKGASLFIEDSHGIDAVEYVTNQDVYSHRNRRSGDNINEICRYVSSLNDDADLCLNMRRELEPTLHIPFGFSA